MGRFMDENYLLESESAKLLYFRYAKDQPIFDYHCHLTAQDIFANQKFRNITDVWLGGDHYKWRLLRANGVPEAFITGDKSDEEKFRKWAETVPYTVGNPLYEWTHMELQNFFGIDEILNEKTADFVWKECNRLLAQDDFTPRRLIEGSNVRILCTTDDPVDTLEFHIQLKNDRSFQVQVLPTFRPDAAINIEKESFSAWVKKLEDVSRIQIRYFSDFLDALKSRIEFFHQNGCRFSDHGIDTHFFEPAHEEDVSAIFEKGCSNAHLTNEEITKFKGAVLTFLGREYSSHQWVMQLHIGGLRDTNTRMFHVLGPNTGYDSMSDLSFAKDLVGLFDTLDKQDSLPKTILYNLNPRDNAMFAAMVGNFQRDIPGKLQFGSAWWFNDTKSGMREQMKSLANVGLISRFVGMVTDSRSFLSYVRHDYFRRILCSFLGEFVEEGRYPADFDTLGQIVADICFNNIKNYSGVEDRLV